LGTGTAIIAEDENAEAEDLRNMGVGTYELVHMIESEASSSYTYPEAGAKDQRHS
jgi:hypothetical protein